jgi:hypothetical protein
MPNNSVPLLLSTTRKRSSRTTDDCLHVEEVTVSETININKCEAVEYISHLKTVLQMKLDQCERTLASYDDGYIVGTGPSPADVGVESSNDCYGHILLEIYPSS